MATNDVLIDIEAVSALILVGTTGVSNISELPQNVVDAGRRVIDRVLKGFNKRYADLLDKSKADLASMKSSLDKQINDLKAQIKAQEEATEEKIEQAVEFHRGQRDEVSRRADAERADMEKERARLEKRREEARAEVERYRRETAEAQRIQAEAEQAFKEEQDRIEELNATVSRLERQVGDLQAESQLWEREASRTATLRENAEEALQRVQEEAARANRRRQELQREVDKLKPELKRAREQILDQEQKLATCQEQLNDAKEELHNLQPDTPAGTPRSSTKAPSPLSDLASNRTRDTESRSGKSGSSPKSSLSRTDSLQRAEDRYVELVATIETDYVPRTEHDRAIADVTRELEDLKIERGNGKQAEVNCLAALGRLRDELAEERENKRANDARVEWLQARIRELERQITVLDAEARTHRGDNANQRDRIRDLERQLKAARESIVDREKRLTQYNERIGGLEKQERVQQTMITTLRTEIAGLRNATSAGAGSNNDKDNEIRRLSDELELVRNELVAARQGANGMNAELEREREALRALQSRYDELRTTLSDRIADLQAENTRLTAENSGPPDERLNNCERAREQLLAENQRLLAENTRLTAENSGPPDGRLNDCERARERLLAENQRLLAENQRLQAQIQNFQDQITALGADADLAAQNRQLRERVNELVAENRRLNDLNRQLQDEIEIIRRERQTLRDELARQEGIINGNGEQAGRTQATLDEQITIFHQEQLELSRQVEALSGNNIDQARLAAETNRVLRFASDIVRTHQDAIQALTIERDLLQDEVQLCVEVQQRARQRARENAAANPEGRPVIVVQPRENLFVRTFNYPLTVLSYTAVWATLVVITVMMLAVIIAEGRRYAEWTAANEHSRALFMSLKRRPQLCLSPPTMDYFWHTVGMALIGRWSSTRA
ncbi:hypothetical protein GQX73_g4509 [Xylaria multiplex]|uniref:Uncharacterized protein n=1 Tax=Xylaria multiplex TaxID=323545 RepID=A0A7C8IT04_9PEZI|nr:hypothetical protein GQX73_g4509 [Xylaria multiplex]